LFNKLKYFSAFSNAIDTIIELREKNRKVFYELFAYKGSSEGDIQFLAVIDLECFSRSKNMVTSTLGLKRDSISVIIMKVIKKTEEGSEMKEVKFTEKEEKQRRYRLQNKSDIFGDISFDTGLTLYLKGLGYKRGKELLNVLNKVNWKEIKTKEKIVKVLKAIGDYYKKYGEEASLNWMIFVNLENIGGYRKNKDVSTFTAAVEKWVQTKYEHKYEGSEALFNKKFRFYVNQFFVRFHKIQSGKRIMSREQYIESGKWAGSGSSSGQKLHYESEGKLKTFRRTKLSSFLANRFDKLVSSLTEKKKDVSKVIQKLEAGKARAVINAGLESFLKMDFLSQWVDDGFKGSEISSLFCGNKYLMNKWSTISQSCSNQNWKVPLDQSEFDHQITSDMIFILIEETKNVVPKEEHEVLDAMWYGIKNGEVKITDEIVIKWEKGVLSGWRWTALWDTICNYAELQMAKDLSNSTTEVIDEMVQGDDDRVEVLDLSTVLGLISAYNCLELEINPSKFFVSTTRDEYLRVVFQKGKCIGYPARSINSVLWKKPTAAEELPGDMKIRSTIRNWVSLSNRLEAKDVYKYDMLNDISGMLQISRKEVVRVIVTPASVGGIGYGNLWNLGDSDYGLTLKIPIYKKNIDKIGINAYTELNWKRNFRDIGASYDEKDVYNSLKDALKTTDWEYKLLTKGELIKTEIPKGVKFSSGRLIDYRASWAPSKIPLLFRSIIVNQFVLEKEWGKISNMLDDKSRGMFDVLRKTASKAVLIGWLNGQLSWSSPGSKYLSEGFMSILSDKWADQMYMRVLGMSNVSMRMLRTVSLQIERKLAKLEEEYFLNNGIRIIC
jgi:hypothetical protein